MMIESRGQENQKNEIAALIARGRPQAGHADPPRYSFPTTGPQMIPQFVGKETREARRLKVIQNNGRPLPTTPLRCAETSPGDVGVENAPEMEIGDQASVDFITKVVEQVIKKMGITGVSFASESSSPSKPRPGKRAPSKRAKGIKDQQSKMSREHDLWWKVC